MTIFHKINPFLYNLFSVKENDKTTLIESIREYYTIDGIVPDVIEENGFLRVSVDTSRLLINVSDVSYLISLCEKGDYEKAYPLAQKLTKIHRTNSEIFRIKGQIESDLGMPDKAINSLIDALRWDPENVYALIMMGNVFARDKDDLDTALKYYTQASELDSADHISVNNIGAQLLMRNRMEEAKPYFERALELNSSYPNTHFGLGLISFNEKNYSISFDHALNALQLNPQKDKLFEQTLDLLREISNKVNDSSDAILAVETYSRKLELLTNKKIRIEKDPDIPTAAKVELAENHNKNYHLVKYKPEYPCVIHLVLHELTHIELAEEARLAGENMLFTATRNHRRKFIVDYTKYAEFLQKKGYPETSIAGVLNSLFDGLNRQVFNTPIDLFIEDRLFKNFPALRPVQFISLYTLLMEGKDAVTRKDILELTDAKIISKSKIYNLITALHFKDLFGVDLVKSFRPNPRELQQAQSFYEEYNDYRADKEPGEEYELVQHWGDDLALYKYFELVKETEFRSKPKLAETILNIPENDADTEANQAIEMHEFQEKHKDADLNPAVMMFMVGALKYFQDKPKDEIKVTAFQIASIGVNGIDPGKKDGYKVPSIPGSNFSGYQMLAYYYVSWALAAPQLLPDLQLPFDKEFEAAKAFIKA